MIFLQYMVRNFKLIAHFWDIQSFYIVLRRTYNVKWVFTTGLIVTFVAYVFNHRPHGIYMSILTQIHRNYLLQSQKHTINTGIYMVNHNI